jgi:hypothetical protein
MALHELKEDRPAGLPLLARNKRYDGIMCLPHCRSVLRELGWPSSTPVTPLSCVA